VRRWCCKKREREKKEVELNVEGKNTREEANKQATTIQRDSVEPERERESLRRRRRKKSVQHEGFPGGLPP
jgi:hypothetical protein